MVVVLERLKSEDAKKNSKSADATFYNDFPARKLPDFYMALSKIMTECGFQPLEIDEETRKHLYQELAEKGFKPDKRTVELVDMFNGVREVREVKNRNKKKLTLNLKNINCAGGVGNNNNNSSSGDNNNNGINTAAADKSTSRKRRATGASDADGSKTASLPLKKRVIRDDDDDDLFPETDNTFLPKALDKEKMIADAKERVEKIKEQLRSKEVDAVSDVETQMGDSQAAQDMLADYDDITDDDELGSDCAGMDQTVEALQTSFSTLKKNKMG